MQPEGKTARNERRKAVATTLNAIGVATAIASFLQPLFGQTAKGETILLGFAIFIAMQGALHAVLRGLED